MRAIFHLCLHFIVPLWIARRFYATNWLVTFFVLVATMVIDVDHFLADPIYDPNRCGLGFHPLHSFPAVGGYGLLLIPKVTRTIGIGLCTHIILDGLDCVAINMP